VGVDVLNGIAYDARHDRLFVTGKLWPKIFELKLKHTDLLDKAH
ncbi:MAG: glutaminyl-peptide cyclotransferase, partial [Dokdonella sp.]